jgi:prepilin-type processing-associated H-X9-DG protein
MHQLAVAWLAFLPDHGGTFVSAYSGDWVGGGDSLESVTGGQLGPYTEDPRIYRCPSDPWKHWRTYSINWWLNGEACKMPGQGARRLSDLKRPDSTFCFGEEFDERGENLHSFVVFYELWPTVWADAPAVWHFSGCNLTFADGHVECWTWQDPRTLLLNGGHNIGQPQNPDLQRLARAVGAP